MHQDDIASTQQRLDLLDLVVIASENLRKLIIVPLLIGALAFGAIKIFGLQQFQSETVLKINAQEIELFKIATVLDPVLSNSPWLSRFDNSLTRARNELLQSLMITKIEDTPYYRVSLKAPSATEANNLLIGLVRELMKQSVPKGQLRDEMVADINAGKDALNILKVSLDKLATSAGQPASSNSISAGDIGQSIASLVTSIEEKRQKLTNAERSLNGTVTRDDVIQPPTLPDSGVTSRQLTILLFVVVMAGVATFAAVILKEILNRSLQLKSNATRAARIRKAFSFKKA